MFQPFLKDREDSDVLFRPTLFLLFLFLAARSEPERISFTSDFRLMIGE
jgi:hypothetical protein